jgi:hypothetical protein
MRKFVAVCGVAAMTSACASRSENIAAAYVSPNSYASYGCGALRDEAARVSSRAIQVSGAQDQKATNDAIATGVAVVLFWPALFLVKGEGASAGEVSRLKGEMDAIEQASIRKRCGIQFRRS